MPGIWPPPSLWPLSEEDGGFSIEFRFLHNVPGLIADVDQEAVVAKAPGKFATYNGFRGGSFPHHFMLVYPLHGIPWLLVRLHGSLFGSQEFFNKLVYLEVFSSFRTTPSAYSCFGNRRARGLEVSWDNKVRGRWIPAAHIFLEFDNLPCYPLRGRPHRLPFRQPFYNGPQYSPDSLIFHVPHDKEFQGYRPRYGRFEIMQILANYILEVRQRSPDEIIPVTEELSAIKTDCSQMNISTKIQKEDFTIRLLLQALQTLWATVNTHGAFT